MAYLTPKIRDEIELHFNSERLGFQDSSWRTKYTQYFEPESAIAQTEAASANHSLTPMRTSLLPLSHGSPMHTTTTFSPGKDIEMLPTRRRCVNHLNCRLRIGRKWLFAIGVFLLMGTTVGMSVGIWHTLKFK